MGDKYIQKILDDSDKAEFLENVTKVLPKCRRIIVAFEIPSEDKPDVTDYNYAQWGFKMTYEVMGFLELVKEMVIEATAEE